MISKLFKFPIILIDGDSEERRMQQNQSMGLDDDIEVDVIVGEAECPFDDFVSLSDRWLPSDESLEYAKSGKFEACLVSFERAGTYVVPWNKTKFKKELQKFADNYYKKDA